MKIGLKIIIRQRFIENRSSILVHIKHYLLLITLEY